MLFFHYPLFHREMEAILFYLKPHLSMLRTQIWSSTLCLGKHQMVLSPIHWVLDALTLWVWTKSRRYLWLGSLLAHHLSSILLWKLLAPVVQLPVSLSLFSSLVQSHHTLHWLIQTFPQTPAVFSYYWKTLLEHVTVEPHTQCVRSHMYDFAQDFKATALSN